MKKKAQMATISMKELKSICSILKKITKLTVKLKVGKDANKYYNKFQNEAQRSVTQGAARRIKKKYERSASRHSPATDLSPSTTIPALSIPSLGHPEGQARHPW